MYALENFPRQLFFLTENFYQQEVFFKTTLLKQIFSNQTFFQSNCRLAKEVFLQSKVSPTNSFSTLNFLPIKHFLLLLLLLLLLRRIFSAQKFFFNKNDSFRKNFFAKTCSKIFVFRRKIFASSKIFALTEIVSTKRTKCTCGTNKIPTKIFFAKKLVMKIVFQLLF